MAKKVTRLFEQFQPQNYELSLVPDRVSMTFTGKVVIRGQKVGRPSQRITLHQKDLNITSVRLIKHDKKGDKPVELARINLQKSFDEVRLHTNEMLYPGEYSVTIEFSGQITRPMNGIYPCYFKYAGKQKALIATQFESHHARQAFPCVDEPEAKATFDLTLTTPKGETVLANTPFKSQKAAGEIVKTIFETTPKMSTYLLAFVYGELGYKEAKTKDGVVVRTYATPDNVKLTRHGLDVAVRVLEFFSDYFAVPYPLPKLDMVALPDFSSGAMENWGLVTYRETAMLADDKTSSIESKQMVALVVAHELSHQWFGNLVTMKWWDDLWLNESFANLMEYRSVDALYPEWQIWEQFVSMETGSAKRRDSLLDVQPIKSEVRHPDEISTLFDPSIVYAKGGTVLHMLMHYIGEATFRKGLKSYFDKHKYGNTQAKDLWEALGSASQQNITDFMDGWLSRPGFPLVNIDWPTKASAAQLSQRRFLSDPQVQPSDNQPWQVPLAATRPLSPALLAKPQATVKVDTSAAEPLLLNHDGHSYFIPHYLQDSHRQQIVKALQHRQVNAIDRLLLLDNYTLLQRGGVASTTELLDLLQAYSGEDNESVWGSIAMALAEVRKLVEGDEASEIQLDKLIEKLVMPTVERLGWEDKPDDSAQTLRLRGLALSLAASAKVDEVTKEGLKRFKTFKKPADLTASTRGVVYFIGARHGNKADFDKLLKLHATITNADEKDELAGGLTATKDSAQFKRLLKLLTTDEVRRQDLMHWFAWLLRNRYSRSAAWQWLTTNWDWIEKEFSSDKSYSFFARYAGNVFSRKKELVDFEKFFVPKKKIVALSRDIALGEQEIGSRLAWRERNEAAVKAWLKKYSR